ncbi:unnamed protein product [Coregonus sp. 'balchen']|nr:unnamed protein product [Coregonus sp. 'balchen']
MPLTNKVNSSAAGGPGQVSAPDHGEPPPPQAEPRDLAAGDGGVGGDEDQGDLQIKKSPSDPKKYRYIELTNGLRVLLISDFSGADGKDASREEEEEGASGGGEEEEEEGDSGEGTEEEDEDAEEEHDSDFEELDEEQEGKPKKGSSEKQSAAALCVSVGSFSDPEDLPGLAHFLEHKYQLARPSDSHRKEMLFGSLARPKHPMGKFCWGNAQTLKHEPREKQINTYQRLQDFWKRYYSAHYMTLTVQSKETLNTLEEWVREIFSKVPNNAQPRPDFSDLQDPFDTPTFNKLYRIVPVRKVHALTITWALPPQGKQYRVKPLHYISWLIGHEGTGSILSLLRKKCWALALFGGNSETGFDQNTTYSIFSISITLTDEGFQNFHQVVHLVFQYMKMLQTLGPQQRIYEEIQKIEANEFHYQEQTDPIEYVENICENMQLFPKEDFLTGDQLMFEYNPEEWAQRWAGDFDLNPDLHLPAENKFIATDFSLKPSDCPDTEVPVRIMNNERGCLWFKKDNKFKIPKAYVRFNLLSPMIQKSPENLVLFDIFVNILAHNLAEPAYEADVAQLEYKLIAGEHGLVIRVKGFNHKLPLLLNLIVDHLADFTAEPGVFTMFAEQLKKTYFNILIKPERLGKDVRLLILEHCRWSVIQKYQAIMKGLTVDDLMTFVSGLKAQLYTEGLVQGNFTSTKPHLCKVKSLNKGDANSEVTVYYQSGLKNLREHTLMDYQVYPTCRNTSGVLGFSITVETQATKFKGSSEEKDGSVVFSTDFVETKIEEFLVSFGEKMTNLTDEAFKTQVTALIKLKECEDTHLGEEVDRNWFEVVTQQYVFDRLNREIEALKLITKAELVSWFMEHRDATSKKLSVHVVGFGEEENDQAGQSSCGLAGGEEDQGQALKTSSYGEVSKLTFLPASPMLADATLINDIRAFTSSLTLYPYHKILK